MRLPSTDPDFVSPGDVASQKDWDATVTEWLAGLFLMPLSSDAIASYRSGLGAILLDELEQRADCRDGVMRMRSALGGLQSVPALTRKVGTAFATLFEGAGGPRTVSPFESAHVGPGGRLFQVAAVDMERLLREAGLTMIRNVGEPADHLSIELALLARQLRDPSHQGAASFLDRRLLTWVPGFVDQVRTADHTGFYAGAGLLLEGFLEALRSAMAAAHGVQALVPTSIEQMGRMRA